MPYEVSYQAGIINGRKYRGRKVVKLIFYSEDVLLLSKLKIYL